MGQMFKGSQTFVSKFLNKTLVGYDKFLSLFNIEYTPEEIEDLKKELKVEEIRIKNFEEFNEFFFFNTLLNDFLSKLPTSLPLFHDNLRQVGILLPIFYRCASILTNETLSNPKMRYYFSLLPLLTYEENKRKVISSLTQIILLAYNLQPDIEVNSTDLIQLFFQDYFYTIYKYVYSQSISEETCIKQSEIICDIGLNKIKAINRELANITGINSRKEFRIFLNLYAGSAFPYQKSVLLKNDLPFFYDLVKTYYQYAEFKASVFPNCSDGIASSVLYNSIIETLTKQNNIQDYSESIFNIINNNSNILAFIKILQSKIITEYYTNEFVKVEKTSFDYKTTISLISEYEIEYYKEYINKTIIILPLEREHKGITNGFLRIAINPRWITVNDNNDSSNLDKVRFTYIINTM